MKLLRRTAGPMHTCVPLSQNGKSDFSVRYSLQKLPNKQTKNIIIFIIHIRYKENKDKT